VKGLRRTIAIAAIGSAVWALAPAVHASVATALGLSVSGAQLVDTNGTPVTLRGVNRAGTEYACIQGWGIFSGPSDASSVAAMASWHINTVRVPLNEDCWLNINGVNPAYGGANYQTAIVNYVALLHQYGLYAILDLHWNAPGVLPATGPQPMADADHAPAFWQSVAATFKTDPAVVFDLYNEPYGIDWNCWLNGCSSLGWQTAGMQSLVDAVRSTGATQPVMAGGLQWANDLSQWLVYKPVDPVHAVLASFHLYNFNACVTSSCWTGVILPVTRQVPVVTGELGENDCAHGFTDQYMPWADTNAVSYLGWTWDAWSNGCSLGPTLITAYDGTPTNFGVGLRDHLAALTH
jgi:endoglucanase